jgi:hypothetical protein
MSQFTYNLPSGAKFIMTAPAGTTQAQADNIFYSQVAAGALVGFKPGQSVSSTTSSLAKFSLSRLDRGTAGVDDSVILAIVNGLPTVNTATGAIPSLVNTPLQNPVTQANIAAITGTGFTAPAIGPLTNIQVQALMAQVATVVDQPNTTATNTTGVGRYGLTCQQLEMAGYVKPGTWQQFIKSGPSTQIEVLSAPGIWTGLNGIYSLTDFLNSTTAQNNAQATLMANGYASLQAAGVITTPSSQSISTVVGQVYTGGSQASTATTVTNSVNSQVAALVTNSSQYGTALTAQWANGLPALSTATSNQVSIRGQSGTNSNNNNNNNVNLNTIIAGGVVALATSQTAMNLLGKASQFAANAASTLGGAIGNISLSGIGNSIGNISLSGIGNSLGNISLSDLTAKLPNVSSLTANLPSLSSLTGQLEGQAKMLLAQAEGQLSPLIAQGDTLVASVQQAAGFANTVNRATVDVAFNKILGSSKIPTPNFGTADSASVGAAADIAQAKNMLQNLQPKSILSGISSSSSQGFGSTLIG